MAPGARLRSVLVLHGQGVDAKRPKILAFELDQIPRPAAFPIARLTEDQAVAGVKALLRKRARVDQFSGAALVAKDGKVLFSGAYGLADRERVIANTLETRFRIGSMNQMATIVAPAAPLWGAPSAAPAE